MNNETKTNPPPLWGVLAAFAAVYIIWGSTYLGIRYAIESIPPLLMSGSRNLVAGTILYVFARSRGAAHPTRPEWRDATIIGALLLFIGNGGVSWAEQVIPSSVAALLVALTPAWMLLFDSLRPHGRRPGPLVLVGLVVGFLGVALLTRGRPHNIGSAYGWGVVVLMTSSISWALGSIFSRTARKPPSPFLACAMQLLAGGVLLILTGLATGEYQRFSFAQITWVSFSAWLYLILAGSLVGFTAYIWLLHVSTPAKVSTYGYVNPLIAVLLGCTLGHETLSPEILMAGALIIVAVVLLVSGGKPAPPASEEVAG